MEDGSKTLELLEKVIGMTEENAVAAIKGAGMVARVKHHGESYRGDCAHAKNRMTITIKDGKVLISSLG